ncbi:SHOCT domain-containing protein [Propionibacterium sp.]|uniref:SHOCT domain-containing protein n=1 Tax=Propionibacterium sp. TaxID=1977903 RepID=UPI0039EA31A0
MANDFLQFFWLVIEIFFFIAYLMVFFMIISDLFRDKSVGGVAKAIWILVLIVFPLIGALVYLIARGGGMETRRREAAIKAENDVEDYIRQTAGTSPAAEIAQAQELLAKGVITEEEFAAIKKQALAG